MNNIIVAIDFTSLSDQLVRSAVEVAIKYEAKLWLIHVAAPEPDFVGYKAGPPSVREYRAHELRQEHRDLQHLSESIEKQGVPAEALLIAESTVKGLLGKMQSLNAIMLIIGAHSKSWLSEQLHGNTWYSVVRKSNIPVLIIPERK